jgi:polar amino acid transport system substrate-binding protein
MSKLKNIFFAAIVLICLPIKANFHEIKVIAHELKPFTWEDNGKVKGLAYDMIVATMQNMNIKTEIKLLPFKRALLMVQNDQNIALFHVQRTPERENTMKWVGPIVTNSVYVYCHKNSAHKIKSLNDLRKLKHIAVVNGEATDEFLTKRGFTNLIRVRQQAQSLEMIINERAEASAFGELVIGAYAQEAKIDISQIEKTGIKLFDSVLYIGFSKNVPDEITKKWQNALDEVKRNQYGILFNKYIHKQ